MISLISGLFKLFAYVAQILGLVLIGVGIFVPEARGYFISRGVVLTILGGFGFYFHDKLDDWLEEKRNKKRKRENDKIKKETEEALKKEQEEKQFYDSLTDAQKKRLNQKKKFKKVLRFCVYICLIIGPIMLLLGNFTLAFLCLSFLFLMLVYSLLTDLLKLISSIISRI